jgi:hypothetical protein
MKQKDYVNGGDSWPVDFMALPSELVEIGK